MKVTCLKAKLKLRELFFLVSAICSMFVANGQSDVLRTGDSLSLVAVYTNAIGQNWINKSGWLAGGEITTWYGVGTTEINGSLRVTSLSLPNNNLTGTLTISALNELQVLDVRNNPLLGGSSDYSQNIKLTFVEGSNTGMGLPNNIGILSQLRVLNLNGNGISTNLPPSITALSNLTFLGLRDNKLSGNIPSAISSLLNLEVLDLGNNLLTGVIPITIGALPKLTYINLGSNSLTGSIPPQIGNLTLLERLYLPVNQLSGTIPSQIWNLTNLKTLWLGRNQLDGSISSSIGNLTSLEELILDNNSFSGTIPSQIGSLTNLKALFVNSNQLAGNIPPELGNLTNLEKLDVGANQLTGTVPSTLNNLVKLKHFSLCTNLLNGTLPANFLSNSLQLETLYLCNNFGLTGAVPLSCLSSPALTYANLVSTSFDGLPNISTRQIFSKPNGKVEVMSSSFTFEDIEPNRNIAPSKFFYSPQSEISAAPVTILAQQPLSLSFTVGGSANSYQWQKNSVNIPGANNNAYSKTNAVLDDGGNYTLVVTNSLVPSLTIKRWVNVTVNRLTQTITFPTIPTKSVNDPSFALGATASSGLAVSYTSSNTAVATISGNTVTIQGLGTTTITVSQSGDATYDPAPSVQRTLVVTPPNDLCSGATQLSLQSTTSGTTTSATADAAPDCGTATDGTGGGVWYSVIGNGKNITASLCNGTNYDSQLRVFSGSCSSLVCVAGNDEFCGSQSRVVWNSVDGTTYLILVHGWDNITGNFTLELTDKTEQTISFSQPPPFLTTSLPSNVLGLASASSGLPLSFSSSNASVATVTNGILTFTGVGTTDIAATQAGNSDYAAAIQVVRTVTVLDGTTSPYGFHKSAGVAITDAQFANPTSLDYDANGNLYVLDGGKVKVFDPSGVFIRAIGGLGSQAGMFGSPNDFEVAANGNVYVLDTGKKGIHVFNATGVYQKFFGYFQSGDNQSSVFAFIDSDETNSHIFVSDGRNHSIKEFDADGNFITKWGTQGSGDGQLNAPRGIKVKSGKVYVVELSNNRVSVFTTAGVFASKFSTALGTLNGSSLANPRQVEVDGSGNVYVSTLGYLTILKFDNVGTFASNFGTFGFANGLAINPSGNIVASDQNAGTIQVFTPAGAIAQTIFSLTAGQLSSPNGIEFDAVNQKFYVSDASHRVQSFDAQGNFLSQFGGYGSGNSQFRYPGGMAVDAGGQLYVADGLNSRIQVYSSAGAFVKTIAINPDANVTFPNEVALDGNGNMYVTDSNNNRVLIYDSQGVFQTQFGTSGTGDGQFSGPSGLALAANGDILVVDQFNNRIQVFSNAGVFKSKWGISGGGAGQFVFPYRIVIDVQGKVYVTDFNNSRIQVFNSAGVYQYTIGSYGSGATEIRSPRGISLSPDGILWVADGANNRAQAFGSPDINLKEGTQSIASGSTYDFGTKEVNSFTGKPILVENLGLGNLNIYAPILTLTGSTAFGWQYPAGLSLVEPGQQSQFSLIFYPQSIGSFTGQLTISSNDPDEKIYVINLQGTSVKKSQIITFGALAAKLTSDPTFTLGASSTSALAVSYVSSNGSVATVTGNTVTIVGVGTTTITASQPGDANYNAATAVPQTLTVSKGNQNITFDPLPPKGFGDAAFALSATSSAGLALTYTSSNTSVASVTGSTVTLVGVGTTTITASQTGDVNFNAATSVSQTLTVSKGNQTITFGALPAKLTTDVPFSLTASSSSNLPVSFSSSNTAVATIIGNTVTIVGAGTSTITASQAGNTNYTAANSVTQPLVVSSKTSQTITFNSLAAKTFGDGTFSLSATSSSQLAVGYTSSNPAVATISGNIVTIVGAGTSTITASQSGDATFNQATNVSQTLTVNKANQTITFGALPAKLTGDTPFALTASSSSSLPVSFSSSNASVATIIGNTVTIVGAGTSTITASQAGNDNYNTATSVTQPLVVSSKTSQTITFNSLAAKTFGDGTFSLSATSSSQLAVGYTSSNPAVATISGNIVTIVGAGTSTITASQAGDATFNPATSVTQTLNVSKANQTIAFVALPAKLSTDPAFALTASSSSGLPVSYSSSNTAVATISGSMVTLVGAGITNIIASQAGNVNYNAAADVSQTLTVTSKQNQTITFAAIPDKTLGGAAFALTATASSALSVSYATTSDKITISSSQVTLVKAGRATITASQAGDATFNAAPSVEQNFCIKPVKPTITVSGANTEAITLTSNSTTGNQWFKDGTAITGATNATLPVTTVGVYKVQVKVDDCLSEFSADTPFIITGDLSTSSNSITIYPNPVEDFLEVRGLKGEVNNSQLSDMTGRTNTLTLEQRSTVHRANVQHLAAGVYLLRVQQGNSIHQIKFIKK